MGALVYAVFFLSGASGLLLETLWSRQLGLIFGSTTLAISTVLATFMAGLGAGSFWAGRRADRMRDPLAVYALCEGAIGLYALAVPLLLSGYPRLAHALYRTLGDHYMGLSLARFVACALLLGPPATLMGATLPLLCRHLIRHEWQLRRIGTKLGTLYATNTFGAVLGAFSAGFLLLPALGIRATNAAAASINLAICAAVLLARRRDLRTSGPETSAADTGEETQPVTLEALTAATEPAPAALPARVIRTTLLVFSLSGALAMLLEVLWTRALAVVIGSSVYSFTLILTAFLAGLAAGAEWLGRPLSRKKHPVLLLAAMLALQAVLIAATYSVIDRLPELFLWLLRGSSFSVDTILAFQFTLALLTILPPTLAGGALFPLTLRIVASGLARVGRDVGSAYAANTVGAIVGSFAAGFVVLPLLGLETGIFVAAALCLALCVLLLLVAPELSLRRRLLLTFAPILLLALGLHLPRWNRVFFQSGLFRIAIAREIIDDRRWPVPDLVYYRDGIATTVTVEKWGKNYALKNNGKVDASNGDDMPTQIMVGLMPFFFTRTPAPTVAVVGFGSGVTVGAVTQAPAARIDVVELEPAVVEASRFFDAVNNRPLSDPRVRLHIGDGRNFLAQADQRYDVIISEPSNPWITGVSNLFTREYWALAHARLAPRGLFCQWAQLYEMSPARIKTILATFAKEFPFTVVFAAEDLSSDVILVASDEPFKLDRDDLGRRLGEHRFGAEAVRGGVRRAEDLAAYLLLAPDEIAAFTAGAPINTDDNALIEFGAPRDLLSYRQYDPYLAKVYGAGWPYGYFGNLLSGFSAGPERARLAEALLAHGKVREAEHFIRLAGEQAGRAKELALLLAIDPRLPDDLLPPSLPETLPPAELERYARQYARVEQLVRQGAYGTAQEILDKWPPEIADKGGPDLALLYGFAAWHATAYADALDALKPLERDPAYCERRPEALYLLGRVYYTTADYKKGVDLLVRYLARRQGANAPSPSSTVGVTAR